MITKIKIYPRMALEYPEVINSDFNGNKWNLISISTTPEESFLLSPDINFGLKNNNCISTMAIAFADLTPDVYEEIKNEEKYKNLILFKTRHAQKIIDYANKIDNSRDDQGLAINCDAGISRSGAVGAYLSEYYGLDYVEFSEDNSNILPNSYIKMILRSIVEARRYKAKWGIK